MGAADAWGTVADLVSAAANVAIAIGAFRVAAQWKDQQAWRREERIARQKEAALRFLDTFIDTPGARNAALMMSTRSRNIPLWDKSESADRYVSVDWVDVDHAFTYSDSDEYPLDDKSVAIRDSFDDFFGRLARLEAQLEENLIDEKDATFILNHWLWIFGEGRGKEPHMKKLKAYVVRCDLQRVIRLFNRYGVQIKSAT